MARVIDLDCQLISLDGLTKTFLVETGDGRQITGSVAEEFSRGLRPTPNVSYHATFGSDRAAKLCQWTRQPPGYSASSFRGSEFR